MAEKKVNYEAWARNAVAFIRERGLELEFIDWCGGWKPPFSTETSFDINVDPRKEG